MDIEYYDQTTVNDIVTVSPNECRYVYWRAGLRHEKVVNLQSIDYNYRGLVQSVLEKFLASLQKSTTPVITYYQNRRSNPTRVLIHTSDGDITVTPVNQPEVVVINVLFRTP